MGVALCMLLLAPIASAQTADPYVVHPYSDQSFDVPLAAGRWELAVFAEGVSNVTLTDGDRIVVGYAERGPGANFFTVDAPSRLHLALDGAGRFAFTDASLGDRLYEERVAAETATVDRRLGWGLVLQEASGVACVASAGPARVRLYDSSLRLASEAALSPSTTRVPLERLENSVLLVEAAAPTDVSIRVVHAPADCAEGFAPPAAAAPASSPGAAARDAPGFSAAGSVLAALVVAATAGLRRRLLRSPTATSP